MGFGGNDVQLEESWDPFEYKPNYVPWEFVPVPSSHPFHTPDRFYIVNRWR